MPVQVLIDENGTISAVGRIMFRIRLTSWDPGLNKVALTKLIREAAGIPLNEAHDKVNRLLEGECVEFVILDGQVAQRLVDDARALGVKAEDAKTQILAK